MNQNIFNKVPYLRTSREFTKNSKRLEEVLDETYIEIADKVNQRTISTFAVRKPVITGEDWFLTSEKQQSLRQAYDIDGTTAIPHNIDISQIDRFTHMYGTFTDGTNWYGLIPGSNLAIIGQISFYLDATNINFLSGAGAPTLTKGIIVLQWMLNP